jgi:hypothetical protein
MPPAPVDVGVYTHSVGVDPSNKTVILVMRGNGPAPGRREDPGALQILAENNGGGDGVHSELCGVPLLGCAVELFGFAAELFFQQPLGFPAGQPFIGHFDVDADLFAHALRKAFGFARDDVLKATNNKQEPFIYGSLGGDDVALVPPVTPLPASAADPNASSRRDYEFAERVGTREAWDFYLSTYPDGFYAKLAQAQRNKLAAEEARVAATEKAGLRRRSSQTGGGGAKASEQAKAASLARAAEEARMIAEKKKESRVEAGRRS